MVNYRTHIAKESLFNTPPSLPVYVVSLVLEWILENGGIQGIADMNKRRPTSSTAPSTAAAASTNPM